MNPLVVPSSVDLTQEKNWFQTDKYQYLMLRYHLLIDEYQAESTTHPGEILASYHTTEFSEADTTKTFENEFTVVDTDETIISSVRTEEFNSTIQNELIAGIEIPPYKISAGARAALEHKILSSISTSMKSTSSITRREKVSFQVHLTVIKDSPEKIHAAACYRRTRLDVYLHYLDYLLVEYRTTTLGLRKKKKNLPRPEGQKHVNRIRISQPLFTVLYWKLLPESSFCFLESKYEREEKVLRPDEVTLQPLDKSINLALPMKPERPTLYTLSNIAFPYRWIDRQGPWTKADLEAIEMNEAEGSGWWFQYGSKQGKGAK